MNTLIYWAGNHKIIIFKKGQRAKSIVKPPGIHLVRPMDSSSLLLSFTAPQNPTLSVNNQAHSQECQKSLKQAHHKIQPQKSSASFSHKQKEQQTHYIAPFPKSWEQTRNHTLLCWLHDWFLYFQRVHWIWLSSSMFCM